VTLAAVMGLELDMAADAPSLPSSLGNVDFRRTLEHVEVMLAGDNVASYEQIGDGRHYRVDFAHDWALGRSEFCWIDDGLFVQCTDAQLNEPYASTVCGPDLLRVRIASEGTSEYTPPFGERVRSDGPCAVIIIEPANQPPASATFAGRDRAVHIYASRQALAGLYQGREKELPSVLQAFLEGALLQTVVRRMPLKAELLRCLEDLQTCLHEGRTRALFFQSKAVEIFCHAFTALEHEEGFGSVESSLITSRGVLKAQGILRDRFVAPPSLEELAHEVGLSRTGLCAGFRQILDRSVFDYIQDLRMQEALVLLNDRDQSITEIAYAVGYSHVSSFSVAVQRRFGATPSELRRRVAAPAGAGGAGLPL
jgi:AraC family transcriptional activator of pyochelin receptor